MKPFLRDFGWHTLLVAALMLIALRAFVLTPTDAELETGIGSNDPRVQVRALHTKANRQGTTFSRDDIVRMLGSDDPLVQELAMLPNMLRFGRRTLRDAHIEALDERSARRRARFLLNHRIGNFDPMTLAELQEFLQARTPTDDP